MIDSFSVSVPVSVVQTADLCGSDYVTSSRLISSSEETARLWITIECDLFEGPEPGLFRTPPLLLQGDQFYQRWYKFTGGALCLVGCGWYSKDSFKDVEVA